MAESLEDRSDEEEDRIDDTAAQPFVECGGSFLTSSRLR
jgi:hypothetical protein